MSDYLVITGMSGAGRSTAAAALEDAGLVRDRQHAALAADRGGRGRGPARVHPGPGGARARPGGGARVEEALPAIDALRAQGHRVQLVYLDAPQDVLVRRFEGTRRRHPIAERQVAEAIADERRLLEPVRGTGRRRRRHRRAQRQPAAPARHRALRRRLGARACACRWCPSGTSTACPSTPTSSSTAASCPTPTGSRSCGPCRGSTSRCATSSSARTRRAPFLDRVDDLVGALLPAFEEEGKSYLTIALGCTGGRHRSVALAEELGAPAAGTRGARPSSSTGTSTDERKGPGPRVVAVGGGHGLAATLRAVRLYAGEITAVVSVADDGGSSGRLRRQLDIMPPGDLRKCLVALAEEGSALAAAFEQRFEAEELAGHALGNLVIAGLMAALRRPPEGPRRGRPAARGGGPGGARRLGAGGAQGRGRRRGRSRARPRSCAPPHIRRVSLVPADPPASPVALARAGRGRPGRGRPRVAVHERAGGRGGARAWPRRIRRSPGRRVYVANLRPEGEETAGFDVADHVAALAAHGVEVDVVVADPAAIALGDARRARWWTRRWPRPTGGPTTRRDWRPPSAVWSDRDLMTVRVGINGFGRIGRNFLRAARAQGADVEVVAVNDLTDAATNAHLLRYDTTHGRFGGEVRGRGRRTSWWRAERIRVLAERDPKALPWEELGVEVVVESTGRSPPAPTPPPTSRAGAERVVISAPSKDADATFVMGVNDDSFDPARHVVVSNASCTTNCFVPMVKVLDDAFGVRNGLMTTVHAYTNDQNLLDLPHEDLRRARAAAQNIVPASSGAARATGLVLPAMQGRLDGAALRVPVGGRVDHRLHRPGARAP